MPLEKLGTAKALRLLCKACELVAIAAPQRTPRCSTPHTHIPPRIKIQITCPLSLIKMKYIRGSLNTVAWQSMSCLTREKMRRAHNQKSAAHFCGTGWGQISTHCYKEENQMFLRDFQICLLLSFLSVQNISKAWEAALYFEWSFPSEEVATAEQHSRMEVVNIVISRVSTV